MSTQAQDAAQPFVLRRLGVVMEPQAGNPQEAWGVLNPAAARSPGGTLYLFPRLVAEGNYSRIGLAQVRHDETGTPTGVERLGLALEPQEAYELNPQTGGGVEDPRVTLVQPLGLYVMPYTALGRHGPRIALATSPDLLTWTRLGPVRFAPWSGPDLNAYPNKDASFFPNVVVDPQGRPALAMLHRPTLHPIGTAPLQAISEPRESIWISYIPLDLAQTRVSALTEPRDHTVLAAPRQPWEALKIGGGTPPILTPLGWLMLYHGVSGQYTEGVMFQPRVHYSAGALVLDRENPLQIHYRSPLPILAPEAAGEHSGIVPNVVFPTGLDLRPEGYVDVYYGMADSRIGAARLALPATLPPEGETVSDVIPRPR
jgi:predicted GH43/DUF377 family glycosyl hydrolase